MGSGVFFRKTFVLYWGIAINNVIVSGEQWRDSAIHIHVSSLSPNSPLGSLNCHISVSRCALELTIFLNQKGRKWGCWTARAGITVEGVWNLDSYTWRCNRRASVMWIFASSAICWGYRYRASVSSKIGNLTLRD